MPTTKLKNRIIQKKGEQAWQSLCERHPHLSEFSEHEETIIAALGCSEFIFRQCLAHPTLLSECLSKKPVADTVDAFSNALSPLLAGQDEAGLTKALRVFRNQHMARITWLDMLNQQTIETSLTQVSALADALILGAYNSLYQQHCQRYGVPMGEHGPQPMLILGMGKLGGKELNFSSDIDLIFVYPEKGETEGAKKPIENQQFFIKLAQKLINALNKITTDGQVYRVDMRLRPFGDSGPLVMHMAAFEDYYQEQGRHWERFAMIKARVLNPPSPYRQDVENILRPFTFRRYLDFTTIDALREMKGLIASEQRRRQLTSNIKLGAGGIREIEFFAQSFQLIHGGREPALQVKGLKQTLQAIAGKNLASEEDIGALYRHYLFLRKAEHTLQQMNDEQTQLLPDDDMRRAIVAEVMGFEDYDAFLEGLADVCDSVHIMFRGLIDNSEDSHDADDSVFKRCQDAWNLSLSPAEFSALLCPPIHPDDADAIYTRFMAFRDKLSQSRLGQRGRDTLNKLMPEVLYVLIEQAPQKARVVLDRALSVISAITGRTTYLDLLLENPDVLKQLLKLCDRSQWIADQIQRFPLLLDELLTPLYLQQQKTDFNQSLSVYRDELRQSLLRIEPEDVEMTMDAWRQFKLCQQLRIAASDISGSLPIASVSDKLTALAEVMLENVLASAWQHTTDKYGKPAHLQDDEYGFAIIGYGKLGGYELGYGSDLDMVFIHNAPRDSYTNGKRQLDANQFYIKLSQRMMHLLSTKTLFGQLYETDLRLRPSGTSGLLSCHLQGFIKYQKEDAWTWEHQALVRARGITGDSNLLDDFEAARKDILCQHRDVNKLAAEVSQMRQKMREHLLSDTDAGIDLKQCNGGITDIEFIAQFLVLGHASNNAALTRYPDNLRIIDAAREANLLSDSTSQQLQDAYLQLRDRYHQLTLADHRFADQSDLSDLRAEVKKVWSEIFSDAEST